MTRRRWDELTWTEAAALGPAAVAILPIAAVEQHGPHLPLGVDAMSGRHLLDRALEAAPPDLPLLALPMQHVGKSDEHQAFPGTLALSAGTLMQVCLDLGDSVARAGVRRLVLLSSHGGNRPSLDIVAQTLRMRHSMLAVTASWSRLGTPPGLFDATELAFGIHGGAIETSLMLHIRPDLVDMSAAADFTSLAQRVADENEMLSVHGPFGFGWAAQDLNRAGACGDATRASAEKGEAVAAYQAARALRLLAEIARYPLDRIRSQPGMPIAST